MKFLHACLALLCAVSVSPVILAEEESTEPTGYRFYNYWQNEETGELEGLGDLSFADKVISACWIPLSGIVMMWM